MNVQTQDTHPLTLAQYRATLDRFAEQRAHVDELLVAARQRGETARAANLYRYAQELVARQRDFLSTHTTR